MRCPNPMRIGAAVAAGASFLFEPPRATSIALSSPLPLDGARLELRANHHIQIARKSYVARMRRNR